MKDQSVPEIVGASIRRRSLRHFIEAVVVVAAVIGLLFVIAEAEKDVKAFKRAQAERAQQMAIIGGDK
jgi:hypothetical protein